MKHSNLTYKEKILRWFEVNPSKINSLCEEGFHILDWIYDGYKGKLSAKIDLTIKLINKGADLDLVKIENFGKILHTFISPVDSQEENAVFVLNAILKQDNKLKTIRNDLPFLNALILADSIWQRPNSELKNQILYSDISGEIPPFVKDIVHKINYNSHPIIFLLQHYFFLFDDIKIQNANNFLKIDKIHELNENIILEKTPFQYHESPSYIKDALIESSIGVNDSILQVLEKIKLKQSSDSSKVITEAFKAIDDIIKRDFYRNMSADLPQNGVKKNKAKI